MKTDGWLPQFLLVLSRALQALATPLIALLLSTAAGLGARAETAISFCNVLFVGNLCAAGVVTVSFGPRVVLAELRGLALRRGFEVGVFAALSALLSGLIFTALETTSVTNAVLLSRLGPVFYALLAALLLGQAIRGAEWAGFALVVAGVLATVFTGSGLELSRGDWQILASAAVYALVTLVSKRLVEELSLAAVVFCRNFFSTLIFAAIAVALFGFDHFADAFYGPLWGIMLVYALVVIVAAQLAYYSAISSLDPASVARWAAVSPMLAMAYAYFLNGERPSTAQLAGFGFVLAGILVSNLGRRTPPGSSEGGDTAVAAAS